MSPRETAYHSLVLVLQVPAASTMRSMRMKVFACSVLITLPACSGSHSTPADDRTATEGGGTTSVTHTTSATDAASSPEATSSIDSSTEGISASDGVAPTAATSCTTVTSGTVASAPPGVWVNRAPSSQHWTAVASDASGNHLFVTSTIVVPPGNLSSGFWISANGGATWASCGGPLAVASVASNSSGTVLVAAEGLSTSDGEIWTSTNGGAGWSESTPLLDSWTSVASDSAGVHLVAASGGQQGDIWTSSNSGATWTNQTTSGPAHGQPWASVASDATGTNLVAASGGGPWDCSAIAASEADEPPYAGDLWTSSDSGATWTDRTPSGPAHLLDWASVASDSTGTNLVAVGAGIWTSADAGQTWTQQTTSSQQACWVSVASDSTGVYLVAASGVESETGDIWTSADSGVTWTNQTAGTSASGQIWRAVTSDSTGTHLVAITTTGGIWTVTL